MKSIGELKVGRYPPLVVLEAEVPITRMMCHLTTKGVRHAVIVDSEGKLKGIVSAKDIVNFLGGGPKYGIVEKYNGDLYKAIQETAAAEIMNPCSYLYDDDTLYDVINIMMERDIGALPIVDSEMRVIGIISEKHIMALFSESHTYVRVKEIMSTPLITLPPQSTLIEGQKLMISKDIRRLVLKSPSGGLRGILSIKDILRFYCKESTREVLKSGKWRIIWNTPLQNICTREIVMVDPEEDLSQAVRLMRKHSIGCLVTSDGKGIVTERDFLLKLPKVMGVEVFVDEVQKLIAAARIHF